MQQVDLDNIKAVSWLLANAVEIRDAGYGIAQHPFINMMFYKNLSLYEPENVKIFMSDLKETLYRQKDIAGIFVMLNKPWYLTWLKYAKPYMPNKEFSKWFGYAWTSSENPNDDANVSLKTCVSWFKHSSKTAIMTPSDYKNYKNRPTEMVLYRGVSEGRNIYGLSYTANIDKANWFANRWDRYKGVIVLQAKKDDILCYFNTRGEDEYVLDTYKYRNKIREQVARW